VDEKNYRSLKSALPNPFKSMQWNTSMFMNLRSLIGLNSVIIPSEQALRVCSFGGMDLGKSVKMNLCGFE